MAKNDIWLNVKELKRMQDEVDRKWTHKSISLNLRDKLCMLIQQEIDRQQNNQYWANQARKGD